MATRKERHTVQQADCTGFSPHSPHLGALESGVARGVFTAVKHARALDGLHALALFIESLAVGTVAALHARRLAVPFFRQGAARSLARVSAHLIFLTPWTLDHCPRVRKSHLVRVRVRARLKVRSAAWALARVPPHLVLLTL